MLVKETIQKWFEIIIESYSSRLDHIDGLLEQVSKMQLGNDSDISVQLSKFRMQISDIYFELIEIQQEEIQVVDQNA